VFDKKYISNLKEMKKNYLNSNYRKAGNFSIKQRLSTLIAIFLMTFAFGQETITITTTSTDVNWVINFTNSGGAALSWLASGPGLPADIPGTGNNPSFDFSANDGSDITITITSTDDFDFVTVLLAPGRDITAVDLANMENVKTLEMPSNDLTLIDLSTNTALERLVLDNNSLTTVNLLTNTNLEEFDASFNNLTTVSLLGLNNLEFLNISNNELTTLDISGNNLLAQINLDFNLLTTASIGQIITDVDAYGTSGFGHILSLTGNPGDIPANAINSVNNLLSRFWIVRPPVIYDFGDAPNLYGTDIASTGPQHIIGDGDLYLGNIFDDELDAIPSANADGDDLDKQADEDGVNPTDLLGISTSTDNFSLDVDYTNNTPSAANLYAWIDFDRNGAFDVDEFATIAVPFGGAGTVTLTWSNLIANGVDINEGDSYARFRTTSDILTANDTGGIVNNGEVEDYFLVIQLDTDKDGVPDINDNDADNDGILNTDEVGDTNGNGIDDMLELDSDGDTCLDVTEAGFTDGDGDGILGTSPVVVDVNGLITDDALGPITDGFTTPNDLDINGTYDFQEVGISATITTEPTDQDLIIGTTTFSVVATADTYQWQEDKQDGNGFVDIVDGGDYAGATTPDLAVTNSDVTKLLYRYQVIVNNIAFACDPTTTSMDVGYITPEDFDLDGIFDIVDVDDDNDGILDTVEENGDINRDTDGDGQLDRIDLDADGDTCFDVTEGGFTDVNGDGMLGDIPITVDANGQVTSGTDGYTPPADLDGSGTPDFQEAGVAATITTEPTDQDLIIGVTTFSVVATDATYLWQEDKQDGNGFVDIIDGGDYAGATTPDLAVTNSDVTKLLYRYQVIVNNIAFACDPTTTSVDVGYITPIDTDGDLVFDIVDVDDDNDGILDTVEENGDVNRDTDGDGQLDRIDLDADGDTCFDVTEGGFTDVNGDGMLGDIPITVDANGQVTSGVDGYTPPADENGNGTPDFQEAGAMANITTEPTDQIYTPGASSTFSVIIDLAAGDGSYQWEESTDNGTTWLPLADGPDYSGTTTADLTVNTPADFSKVFYMYRVIVANVAYVCDPTTTSVDAEFIIPGDFDKDGVFDIVDVDDDNDGILDTVEENGDINRDTDGDGQLDRIDLDADGDGCPDVDEAGFENNGGDMLGNNNPPAVDATGLVTSATDGYTAPDDLDGSGIPDFQEAGAAATITTQPTDQALIIGVTTFSVVATADTYQWQEDQGGGFVDIIDGGDYAGALTADVQVTNSDVSKLLYRYRVLVNNIAYACDPTTLSSEARYIPPADFDNDGIFDIVDVDDDNDGILDTVEENGDINRDTDGDGALDRVDLDADGDTCFDVTEGGFTDNGVGMLGTSDPPVVDATGLVTSATDGYTAPNDLDGNGTPDFQEAGAVATITTQPTDQNFLPGGNATFTIVATADTYQWEESVDGGTNWSTLTDDATYSGSTTSDLTISNMDVTMLNNLYRVLVNNIAFACDPVTASDTAELVSLPDNDNDGVPDIVDADDDNDGIFDTDEQDALGADMDSNGNGTPDRFELDSDSDGCFDVTEAGFTDGDGDGLLGNSPVTVDANGQVNSGSDGYTTPNDLDNNGVYDFQEIGIDATITTQPVDQDFILDGSATFSVVATGDTYQWEESTDGVNWTALVDDATYSGTTTADLTVSNLQIVNYFSDYRVIVTNIAFACDPGIASSIATYNGLTDTDGDGVFDIIDVDDDNDGIYDTVEGEFTDSNLDGTPDRISLDADGDTCADVLEAGFTDPDGDGILGSSPVSVDVFGEVTGQGGYTTPNDLDGNGVFDFQEAGSASEITNQPEDTEITLGTDATFEVVGDATFYQWEISLDGGSTWTALVNGDGYDSFDGVNTNRLRVNEAYGMLESSLYRVVLSSPDFACDPNSLLVSEAAMLSFNTELIPSGFSPNGDGANDLFKIPSLDQYPDFKIDIFNRWGSKVYSYDNNGSSNPEWWDGYSNEGMTVGDGRVPVGTYFYALYFNGDGEEPQSGWVYVNY